jgi:predicted nucleic acid-binding protein
MNRVFADSFYFFALVSEDDVKHQEALDFATTFVGELVTTGWILTELGDGLARPTWRECFLELHEKLVANSRVQVEPCSDSLLNAGIELYRRRPDKSWSLTDCISFVVMQREGISEALTGDHDFEQAGFIALLR